MIPEWASFQNKSHSRMKFILHSYDKIDRLSHLERPSKRPFCPPSWKPYACAARPRLHGLRFHLRTELVFSLHETRMKCHTRTRISFGLKAEMNSFWNDLCGNKISSQYHVNRYREIYGDGMNSFWNESHSGVMWTAPNTPYANFAYFARMTFCNAMNSSQSRQDSKLLSQLC